MVVFFFLLRSCDFFSSTIFVEAFWNEERNKVELIQYFEKRVHIINNAENWIEHIWHLSVVHRTVRLMLLLIGAVSCYTPVTLMQLTIWRKKNFVVLILCHHHSISSIFLFQFLLKSRLVCHHIYMPTMQWHIYNIYTRSTHFNYHFDQTCTIIDSYYSKYSP